MATTVDLPIYMPTVWGFVMQSYAGTSKMERDMLHDDAPTDWIPADDEPLKISVDQINSGGFCTLSEDDTKALEEMSASRVKTPKPEPLAQYRKPKNELFANFAPFAPAFNQAIVGAIAVGLVVAFFVGMSGIRYGAPSTVAKVAEPSHARPMLVRKSSRSAPLASNSRAFASASSASFAVQPAAAKPIVVPGESLPEYKGPSSVTGLPVPHRRAYQASSITSSPAQ